MVLPGRRRRALTVLGVCALAVSVVTPTATADPSRLGPALRAVVAAGVPASYAEAVTGGSPERGVAGTAELGQARAPNPKGRFRVASVTKTFVATVVLQLVGEGKLGLDDPVAGHLPGLLPYPEPITVRQLLGHTSGLPRDIAHWTTLAEVDTLRFQRFGPEQLVRESTTGKPLLFAPGTSFSYSNTGYTVLGLLVEKLTGRPFAVELARRITVPLGLRDTEFPAHQPFLLRPAARGYEQLYPDKPPTDVTTYVMSRVWASGNLISSARDLNRFFAALLAGDLLPPAQLREMTTARPNALGPFGYGLGLMTVAGPCGGPDWWGHGGDFAGFNTWSMHTRAADRQISAGMSMDLTAPPAARLAMLNQVLPAALCTGPASRTATQLTSPDLR
ncbi:serine hydrolase [Crossiella sp. CA-258035]|uniref:serine hydrolase domain-containing protein n=1 Tax=Crossiella sp. CA-258035 TaxID=2981138 RepID=UPI0024BD5BCD|nr:serine hydrolase domain-containing protein [Crossiella sp. CA-258035]WHT23212.1 serine hydrolase [Crossiella sp. CA-258035]